jgi:hypothetical protein
MTATTIAPEEAKEPGTAPTKIQMLLVNLSNKPLPQKQK